MASWSPTSRRTRRPSGSGFQKGDRIISVDGESVNSTKELEKLQKVRDYYWKLTIGRGDQVVTTVVGG